MDGATTPEQDRQLLYLLTLSRHVQERMESMHRQGRLPGPVHLAMGQEAVGVGAAFALRPEDSLFATAWDLAAQLARGVDLGGVLADAWGRVGGPTRGRDALGRGDWLGVRTFATPTTLPDGAPEAAGAALAYRIRGEARVAMCMGGGDDARNDRWRRSVEASVGLRLPVVWVLRSAGDARTIGVPAGEAVEVPGSDVREVHGAAVEAVQRARSGGGPTVIAASPPDGDPVQRFAELLVSEGTLDQTGVDAVRARVAREFNRAYEFGQRSPLPDPSELTASSGRSG